jgi:prepilin-type N-terminal cleavage/methylation domain-containing protein
MRNRESGFTLLEILIAIAILGIIMAMNSTILQEMIRGTKQQGSIVTSQFETALGLEIFRNDLGNAGYGLPDAFSGTITYSEPTTAPEQQFNDGSHAVPRAIVHDNNVSATGYLANSDYLVIRSTAVGMNKATGKWTHITNQAAPVHVWNDSGLDMQTGNYMIVIKPLVSTDGTKEIGELVMKAGGAYSVAYAGSAMSDTDFVPQIGERYLAYGVDSNSVPQMPFNRADYFVARTTSTMAGCAPGTGTLIKAVANQTTTVGFTSYPVMDCVANMQVVFVDTNVPVNSIAGLTAMQIKGQVKEIRVYILAHEGTFDKGFRYGGSDTITVGPDNVLGHDVVLSTLVGTNWDRYRWKTYTLSVKPRSFQ